MSKRCSTTREETNQTYFGPVAQLVYNISYLTRRFRQQTYLGPEIILLLVFFAGCSAQRRPATIIPCDVDNCGKRP